MKSNLDKHIDSKIKNSFESLQRKAPIHLWDTISQEMDLEHTLDDSIDEKVQESYQQVEKTAPAFLWDSISNNLEEATNLDASIDSKVKESFDTKLDKAAPVFLWGAISEDLNQTETGLDQVLDDKVKESFGKEELAKTPNAVWFGINRQLNIDKTWNKISTVLDHKPVVNDWRKRMVQFFGAAAILLLFVKTCDFEPHTDYTNPLIVEKQLVNNEQEKKTALISKKNQGTNKNKTATNALTEKETNHQAEPHLNTHTTSNEQVVGNSDNKRENVTAIPSNSTGSSNAGHLPKGKMPTSIPTNSNGLIPVKEVIKDNNKQDEILIAASKKNNGVIDTDAAQKNSVEGNTENTLIAKTNANNSNTINQSPIEKETIDSKLQENETINWAVLDAVRVGQLPLAFATEPVQLLEDFTLENSKEKKNLVEGKLVAGAFIVVNSTMLINNDTREGFDQNSLTQNYFGLAANYGLWASYKITPKGALVAEFSINADNKSAYGVYDKGVFYVKEWVMKYNRISLAYKHDLWGTDSDKLIDTKIVGQAGLYLGFMREAKLFYDGELFYDALAEHHIMDFGFKVSLGQEILIDKFVLGYGIRSDIGVSNIFKGNNTVGAQDNRTNLINLGGYFSLGYRF